MSHDYIPSAAAFPTPIVMPDATDDATATSINVALEALADELAYLNARTPAFSSTTLVAQFDTASAAYVQVATITFPVAATYMFGMIVRSFIAAPGSNHGDVRMRTSTSFAAAGTAYTPTTVNVVGGGIISRDVGICATIITTTVTGLNLYLEAKLNVGGTFSFYPGTHLFAMAVA